MIELKSIKIKKKNKNIIMLKYNKKTIYRFIRRKTFINDGYFFNLFLKVLKDIFVCFV